MKSITAILIALFVQHDPTEDAVGPENVLELSGAPPIVFPTPTLSAQGSVQLVFVAETEHGHKHMVRGHPVYVKANKTEDPG